MVSAVSSVVTFLFGTVIGVIGTLLVVYCAYCKSRRGKLDLTPAAPLYDDVGVLAPATAAAPQLKLKENVAYGHVQLELKENVAYEQVQLELKENVAYGQVETR